MKATIYDDDNIPKLVVVRRFASVELDDNVKYFILYAQPQDLTKVEGAFVHKGLDNYEIDYQEPFYDRINDIKNSKINVLDLNLLNFNHSQDIEIKNYNNEDKKEKIG